ncbi:MAG TPA: colanic acid biosynthesis glycosyltransferase WcaL [Deltaproteobacteria bacterium]|nr:colanic acid biosynthesis glycosyltransferase WcaL [Deltaproteobacteria bacterium]
MEKRLKIAYLAPEIPALSATFVYNEILELEKTGISVVPVSVHRPGTSAMEKAAKELGKRTHCLYETPLAGFITDNARMFLTNPAGFMKTLCTASRDALGMLAHPRTALGIMYRFCVASTLAKILIENRCRHIHAHFAHIPTDIAMYASSLAGISYSFTAHANDLFERGWLLKEKVQRSGFSAVISGFNKDFLMKNRAPGDKIHVIHCGVDSGTFQPRKRRRTSKTLQIGSLGRMVGKKGFDVLIDTAGILIDSGRSLHMDIAGDGPLMDDLRRQAELKGLADHISFPGPIAHEDVSSWLQDQDIFVLPCRKDNNGDMDGIPVVLMEAMLSGVPVVSTRISGIPELIEDGITGCLAAPDNPSELAAAIEKIAGNSRFRKIITENAAKRVLLDFDLAENTARLAHLYKEVIG